MVRTMTRIDKLSFYLFMSVLGILVINQIIRFSRIDDSINVIIYRYCLVIIALFMIAYVIAQRNFKLNAGSISLVLLILYIGLNDVIHRESLAGIIASLVWIFAFICGQILEVQDIYESNFKFNALLFFIISYFVINDVIGNYTKIIQARSDVISANNLFYFGFPLMVMYKKKKISLPEIIITAAIIIVAAFSFKRSTLIVAVVSIILYYIARLNQNGTSIKRIILVPLFITLIFLSVWQIDKYTGGYISRRFSVISSTGGNGRTEVWTWVFDQMEKAGILTTLFGNGFNSVKETFGISAHNDFLEFYYDFGVIGLLSYIGIVIYITRSLLVSRRKKMDEYPIFLGFFAGYILFSLLSHVFLYAFVSIPVFFFLGYLNKRTRMINGTN